MPLHGVKRRSSSFNTSRVDHLYDDPHDTDVRLRLHYGELTDATNLIRMVQEVQPTEIYNLAAQSHVQIPFETPEYTVNADGWQYGCELISALPTNLFGPGDNYDPLSSHVAAAMQVKVHRAKQANAPAIELWSSGTPRREFLYVDDLADGLVFMLKHYSDESHLNVGTGLDVTIRELAELVAKVGGWRGAFTF